MNSMQDLSQFYPKPDDLSQPHPKPDVKRELEAKPEENPAGENGGEVEQLVETPLKRKPEDSNLEGSSAKKKRRPRTHLSLEQKMEIIKLFENGAPYALISREKNIAESSIRATIAKKHEIREHCSNIGSYMLQAKSRHRSYSMENLERLLLIWIGDLHKKNLPISMSSIKAKARTLFPKIHEFYISHTGSVKHETFSASNGWFNRFKHRSGLVAAKMGGGSLKIDHLSAADDNRVYMDPSTGNFGLNLPALDNIPLNPDEDIDDETLIKLLDEPLKPSEQEDLPPPKREKMEKMEHMEYGYEELVRIKQEMADIEQEEFSVECEVEAEEDVSFLDASDSSILQNYNNHGGRDFSISELSTVIRRIDEVANFLVNRDPSTERSSMVKNTLQGLFKGYRDKLHDLKKERKELKKVQKTQTLQDFM